MLELHHYVAKGDFIYGDSMLAEYSNSKNCKQNIDHIFTFTFMHLADAFIQSDLQCIRVTVSTFYQLLLSLGIEPMILALLAPCSTSWATGKLLTYILLYTADALSEPDFWNTHKSIK